MFKDVKNDYNRFSLKELQKRREVCKFTSERQELIQKFVDKINSQRDSKALKKYGKATWSQINGQLKCCTETDLKYLWNMCEKAKHFSAYFWKMREVNNRKGQFE